MLKITLTGTWPQFQPLGNVMQSLSKRIGDDIRNDVAQGGNPAWPDRVHPPGKAQLGYIPRTLQTTWGNNFARASFGGGIPYAMIHEFGGIIRHPGSDKLQVFQLGDKIIFTHHTKAHDIPIPQRSALSGVYLRKDDYAKFIGKEITITKQVPI